MGSSGQRAINGCVCVYQLGYLGYWWRLSVIWSENCVKNWSHILTWLSITSLFTLISMALYKWCSSLLYLHMSNSVQCTRISSWIFFIWIEGLRTGGCQLLMWQAKSTWSRQLVVFLPGRLQVALAPRGVKLSPMSLPNHPIFYILHCTSYIHNGWR